MVDRVKLTKEGVDAVENFKTLVDALGRHGFSVMAQGRDASLFFTKLEEALYFGCKAISRKSGHFEKEITEGEGVEKTEPQQ